MVVPVLWVDYQCVPLPFATCVLLHSFDLHALDTPPAFVLSQDQTLSNSTLRISQAKLSKFLRPLLLSDYLALYTLGINVTIAQMIIVCDVWTFDWLSLNRLTIQIRLRCERTRAVV